MVLQPHVYLGLPDYFTPRISISCFLPSHVHFKDQSRILRTVNTESSHLDLGLPCFLLPSGWRKVIFMQGTLSSPPSSLCVLAISI
jgi:hypothetical protein